MRGGLSVCGGGQLSLEPDTDLVVTCFYSVTTVTKIALNCLP